MLEVVVALITEVFAVVVVAMELLFRQLVLHIIQSAIEIFILHQLTPTIIRQRIIITIRQLETVRIVILERVMIALLGGF